MTSRLFPVELNKQTPKDGRWLAIPALLFTVGIVLILLSFILPAKALSRSGWTQDQAKRYQAASLKLHSLSQASLHPTADADPAAQHKELARADAEYKMIRAQLDAATNRPQNIAFIMRLIGGGLIAIGGTAVYLGRPERR